MPELALRKTTFSRDPWRIGLVQADGRWQPLQHLHWPRKRDALPTLAALQALAVPWDEPVAQWPEAVRTAVQALVRQAPGWQTWAAAVTRPR